MNRLQSTGTALQGVHHVGKIVSANNCIFQSIAQENDVGNDAYIEFILEQQSTGCCVAAQIKSGPSYVNRGVFALPSDSAHRDYWRNHILPVVGIVYDPDTDTARWIDLTAYLKSNKVSTENHSIAIPDSNVLDKANFGRFREHFLTYKGKYSDDTHFVEALVGLSQIEDYDRCHAGLRSLFAFHRNRVETWFYIISCLRHFTGSNLIRPLVIALCHVPGHPDIFWGKGNIIDEATRKKAMAILRRLITRDDILAMITAIDENGIDRGQLGQCVHSIVEVVDDNVAKLASIAADKSVSDDSRYWAFFLIIIVYQQVDLQRTIELIEQLRPCMPEDQADEIQYLCKNLREHGYVNVY